MAGAAKISISLAEPELLAWAKKRAARDGVSLSAVFSEAIRRERQQEARGRLLEALGPSAALSDKREAELLEELGESAPAKKPAKRLRRR